jgi:non-heme chloroperoxidase
MDRSRALPIAVALAGLSFVSARQAGVSGWTDPSKHKVRFVTVDEGVRLEVLEWGGSGRPVVLREIHAFIAGLPPGASKQ